MEPKKKDWRWLRVVCVSLLGLLILAATLPSTGGIIAGPPRHPDMRRFGPFLFFPGAFFTIIGAVTVSTGCAVVGIVRRSQLEIIGWILLAVLFIGAIISGG